VAAIKADTGAVKTVTDALPDSGALTSLATASALSTADGKLDTLTTRLGAPADFGGGQSIAANLQDAVGSPTFDPSTDSLEAIRDRGDSAWVSADVSGLATAAALSTVDGVVDAIKATTDKLDDTLEDNAGTYRFTDDALAEAPTGGSAPTASEIADAVWDEDLTGHTTPDSAGDTLGSVATGTPPTAAAIADAVWDEATSGHVSAGTFGKAAADTLADAAAILDDTGTSGVVVAAGSKTGFALTSAYDAAKTAAQAGDEMDLVDAPNATAVAAIQSGLSTLDAAGVRTELATELGRIDAAVSTRATPAQVNTEADQALADVGLTSTITGRIDAAISTRLAGASYTAPPSAASIRTEIDSNSTQLEAIAAKTGNLPSDPADQSAVEDAIDAAVSSLAASIAGLENVSAADVKAQIVAALASDTYAEIAGVPAATSTLADRLAWLFALARNTVQQSATTQTLKQDDGTTDLATAAVSDDAGVFERAAWQ
jgi:hypothetical protein